MLSLEHYRRDFPILHQKVNGFPLVYLDNAATSQKPQVVIDALVNYYQKINSNVHRGAHYLADQATIAFDETRKKVQKFINAQYPEEIIFTKGTTESINLVAFSFGEAFVSPQQEILITEMEHHANIVPWQMLCERKKAILKVVPVLEDGTLDIESFYRFLSPNTSLVAITHVSNVLGTINPIQEIIQVAHAAGAKVLVDGAQSVPHFQVNVQELDADFFVFSGHKIFGPTGVGILYGKKELLELMPPYQGGGAMIKEVTFERTTYNRLPHKFEAGTPNIADVIGLGVALDYVQNIGIENIALQEHALTEYATQQLQQIPSLKIIGNTPNKVSVISFVISGIHHYDLGMLLDANGIAIRTGHHCAQPLMRRFGVEGTARASFAFYNTKEEIHKLCEGVEKAIAVLT
ncbi:MAG: cysteine desulfurase [Cytophagales bacterium]|nr:cysteine desulfurase [Cytophagales bacterium]MDW8383667.1 cysteine desulfurase [Flammeovirgaceae bacterium]